MTYRKLAQSLLCAAFIGLASSGVAPAADTIALIVPFPPGGALDSSTRMVAEALTQKTGNNFVVENRPGANGNIGSQVVARADPDGKTLLFNSDGILTTNPELYRGRMGFEPSDLKIIATVGTQPSLLVVNPKFGVRTFQEFLEKSKTAQVSYASGGIGSQGHLTMALLGQKAGLKLKHVPYKGAAPAMTDVLANVVPAAFVAAGGAISHVKSGALLALAVAGPIRLPALPDVPTASEAGLPGFDVTSAYFAYLPKTVPDAATSKLEADLKAVLSDPKLQGRLRAIGIEPSSWTPADAEKWIDDQKKVWSGLISSQGIILQ